MAGPSSSAQKNYVNSFVQATGADKGMALKYLKHHNWSVDMAVSSYLDGASRGQSSSQKKNLTKIFDHFRDEPRESPNLIGPNGMMNYLPQIGVALDDVGMLIVSEIVQSQTMGEIPREGFIEGWGSNDTLEKQRTLVTQRRGTLTVPSSLPTFRSLYRHTFQIARVPTEKGVQLDAAIEYWRLLFSAPSIAWSTPESPFLDWWIEFLKTRVAKSVNKDLWYQTLEFALKSLEDPRLGFWDENGSWPGVIDEFVEFVNKEKRGGGNAGAGVDAEGMDVDA